MLKTVTTLLTDEFGYDFGGCVTHPLRDKYDVMLSSGPVSVLLTDDINTNTLTMLIVENALSTETTFNKEQENWKQVVLHALLDFAVLRIQGS